MPQPAKTRKIIPIKAVADPDAKVYPRSISGVFARWRWVFVWLTQFVFYGLCWLPWHGRQAILLDISQRKFYFFDLVLWPQDTIYLVLLTRVRQFEAKNTRFSSLSLVFKRVSGRIFENACNGTFIVLYLNNSNC